ncbi:MAG: hypothetical protein N0C88_13880 [Candidatus Thiodiazotropha lotti]|uniref:Uncharacterized protein n=1 Tax=Candidatus Thiodiazotropha lotti TaxID=2792787 RepID=A0A9E4N1L4_9GAMM|nr:hypothetical protein [Candidatus Thiodiazotropha lotti]MCW4204393.1 hypothetical protein [Candidatus Thiodiazotropha lotti]
MIDKIKSLRSVLIFAVILLGSALLLLECDKSRPSSCDAIIDVAKNSVKLSYLKSWVNTRLSDKDFLLHMGRLGESNALDSPAHFAKLKIDVDYLGIDESIAFVRLNRGVSVNSPITDSSSIKSITVGEGRSSITLVFGVKGDHGILGFENIRQAVKLRNKEFIVVCR